MIFGVSMFAACCGKVDWMVWVCAVRVHIRILYSYSIFVLDSGDNLPQIAADCGEREVYMICFESKLVFHLLWRLPINLQGWKQHDIINITEV